MKYVMENEGKPYRKFFEDICAIPHESCNEKAISEFLIQFAKERGLWCYSDKIWNVVIKKPASPGYENHDPLMLQAHTDMVCVKAPGSDFNFATDPLNLYVEDGWLKAKDTTLGADCGHGIAYMLAILDDNTLEHPPLECLFSVQEEVGIGGPQFIDYSLFTAKKLINFDVMNEGSVLTSTTHVDGGNINKTVRLENNKQDTFLLTIGGGTGGHGGLDIGKDRANAIKLCAHVLYRFLKAADIKLVSIKGGTARNNIAGSCEAEFTCDSAHFNGLQEIGAEMLAAFKVEYAATDPDIFVTVEPAKMADSNMEELSTKGVIEMLLALPVGVNIRRPLASYSLNEDDPEWAKKITGDDWLFSSRHIGKISTQNDIVVVCYQFRSCLGSQLQVMYNESMLIADKFGAVYERVIKYPGHYSDIDEPLHQLFISIYREATGKKAIGADAHYGTDMGTILDNIPGMTCTCVGPDTAFIHTPMEALNIESFDRVYGYIKAMLKSL